MSWRKSASKMAMGKFVRAKKGQMVIVQFQGEPNEVTGKNFNGEEVPELQFPVIFYDTRPVSQRYESGEPARIVERGEGEDKLFPVQGGPLLREIMEVDDSEGLIGNTFIIKHTGEGQNTAYKFTQVIARKQAKVVVEEDDEEGEDEAGDMDSGEEQEPEEHAGPNPRKEPIKPPSKDREKEKFMTEVKKRTRQSRKLKESESQTQPETTDESD